MMMSQSDAYTDVVELCALLQCLGFSVKSMDTSDANVSQDGGTKTVVINCQKSGMNVVLESAGVTCSCPTPSEQNSGVWQVSGITGGKQLEKEFGCNLLGSLPKSHRDRLSKELHEIIRCIKENNESFVKDDESIVKQVNLDRSASMTELKTPEKMSRVHLKDDTPARYRSLDTLTSNKLSELPAPGMLRARLVSECEDDKSERKKVLLGRQSTYTISSTPGSIHRRNKTSSPIQSCNTSMLENLIAAEKSAEDLRKKLEFIIREIMDDGSDACSMSSLALDVSKISVSKAPETSKCQFASIPNLTGLAMQEDFVKGRLNRLESVSTSDLGQKPKEGKLAKLRRISPNIFTSKKSSPTVKDKAKVQDRINKLSNLLKPKIIINTPKSIPSPAPSPNLSARKKYSHIKSTIPRPAKKETQ